MCSEVGREKRQVQELKQSYVSRAGSGHPSIIRCMLISSQAAQKIPSACRIRSVVAGRRAAVAPACAAATATPAATAAAPATSPPTLAAPAGAASLSSISVRAAAIGHLLHLARQALLLLLLLWSSPVVAATTTTAAATAAAPAAAAAPTAEAAA